MSDPRWSGWMSLPKAREGSHPMWINIQAWGHWPQFVEKGSWKVESGKGMSKELGREELLWRRESNKTVALGSGLCGCLAG